MFKKITFAIAIGVSAHAAESRPPEPGVVYPYIAPQASGCSVIVEPENSGGYFLSKDCKTVLVRPPREGVVEVRSLAVTAFKSDCRAFRSHSDALSKLEERYNKDVELFNNSALDAGDPKRERLREKLEELLEHINRSRSVYANARAASAQLVFNSGFNQNYLESWILKNLHVFNSGIKFVPAPIAESFITFQSIERGGMNSDAVIVASNIPGFKPKTNTTDPTVVAAEVISGQVILGLRGVCAAAKDFDQPGDSLRVDRSDMTAHLVANRTYTVPVQTSVGYTAKLHVKNALKLISESQLTRRQFSLEDIVKVIGSGSSSDAFEFQTTGFESPPGVVSDNDKVSFFSTIRSAVKADLTSRLTALLIGAGVIQVQRIQVDPEPVEGGMTTETRSRPKCVPRYLGERLPFGPVVKIGEDCFEEQYSIPVWNDGKAERVVSQEDGTEYVIQDTVDVNGIIYRSHTQIYSEPKAPQGLIESR